MSTTTATSHLVCLFCVTAGQNGENLGSDEEQIVLFVYLLYDVSNNKIVTLQVQYVRPTPNDDVISTSENVLTEECRIQTNLPEEAIKNAQPLEHVLDEFERFLCAKEVHPDHGGRPFSFCTDGQLHLRMCLLPEATRKNITLPAHFYKFFDLRKEFKKFYKTERPINCIKDMLDFLGIEADQSVEYGVRHCQELAVIIHRLINDGHVFAEPEDIADRLEPGVCTKDDEVDDETVVRARGLPWQSSDQDIARFFRGLNVAKGGVALCLSQQGRRNGEALVRFESKEHRDLALRKHKHHIGQRYIEVYRATGQDFLAVAGGSSDEAHEFLSRHTDTGCQVIVRMRGLPYTCTAQQVLEFFKMGLMSVDVLDGENGILFVHQADGRATGDAFVLFGSDEDANHALTKHRQCIGNRYIELFKSTTAEVQQVLNRSLDPRNSITPEGLDPMMSQLIAFPPPLPGSLVAATTLQHHPTAFIPFTSSVAGSGNLAACPPGTIFPVGASTTAAALVQFPQPLLTSGSKRDCLRVRGLPFEATVADILALLGDCSKNIVYHGVHLVYSASGTPSGEAFIQMDSEHSAETTSLMKSRKQYVIGGRKRYIEVIQCSWDDMSVVLTNGLAAPTTPHPSSAGPAALPLIQTSPQQRLNGSQHQQLLPMSPMCSPLQPQQQGPSGPPPLQQISTAVALPNGSILVQHHQQPQHQPTAIMQAPATIVPRPMITGVPIGASTYMAGPASGQYTNGSALASYSASSMPSGTVQSMIPCAIPTSACTGGLGHATFVPTGPAGQAASIVPVSMTRHTAAALMVPPLVTNGGQLTGSAQTAATMAAFQPIVYWYPSPPVSPPLGSTAAATTSGGYYIQTGAVSSAPTLATPGLPTTVLMKGLPATMQPNDVVAFVDGLVEMIPDVQLMRGGDGRPNGDAYVTFASRCDAERVVNECSRKMIGSHSVDMQMIS